ncbi:5-formyltetrahydrofolate cyclo-ligase [Sporosarcina sp. G11-34]|uniref:5-formyltetrahydrofolate cyclo-ligase n=1 Tax=Sporosarcina sp. G11-34 TaxID=2849605 RepID=UPI0022A94777|nr:5-formyltetrahydrofolate cyclo-ligase [Sporosarcina sp. G11-34]MCZ2260070.1 5-formyltetrahydrofolate cyclo-ligase [Sporosarcina sp. G11-34]
MDKKLIRNRMLEVLNKMSVSEYETLSKKITDQVIASEEFIAAQTIGLTISRFPEVNTLPLIEAAWAMGKHVAVPKCIRATRAMDFRLITSFDNIETVYMNLLEPILSETKAIKKNKIDIQIVPGVVYSNDGFRIGFGGGYYDRYLTEYTGDTISMAFDCQVGSAVPTENHDVPVEKIFTEKRRIICGEGSEL